MAIKDILKNLRGSKTIQKKPVNNGTGVEIGATGTSLFGGILDVEFNTDLDGLSGIETFDTMRKGDATTGAMLEAIKGPVLSAKHFIKEGGKGAQAKQTADFIRVALFEKLQGGYINFVRESFTSLDFGFSLFEKVFFIDEHGFIFWKRFAPRIQSSLQEWTMVSQQKWIDGHPSGITQQLPGDTDDVKNKGTGVAEAGRPEIPWNKLIHFSFRQEGNNFAGVSVWRNAYKHWYYKDILYKIQGISAERFGVGIPTAKHPKGLGKEAKTKLEELLKNIRANEQAFARYEDGIELDILIPKNDAKGNTISDAIAHHDRKIYDSILAGFLNLTTGDGGSNALSKDQSSFFMRTLQGFADYFIGVMNVHIKELVDLNFQNVTEYPTLGIEGIGDVSIDERTKAIETLVNTGLLTPTIQDEMTVREMLGLPTRTAKEIEKDKLEKEEKDKANATIEEKKNEENVKKEEKRDEEDKKQAKKTDQIEKGLAEANAGIVDLRKLQEDQVKKKSKPTLKPKSREQAFSKNITEFENFLENEFKKFEIVLQKAEDKYRRILITTYEAADKVRLEGVEVFAITAKNKKLLKSAESAIDVVTNKLLRPKFINSPLQKELFNKTKALAIKNLKVNEKLLQEIVVNEAKFNSFMAGYVSNIDGVLFNDPRRIKEGLLLNFASQVSVDLAVRQAGQLKFNRNVFKLSTVTHARSAYNNIVISENVKNGVLHYKFLVPANKIDTLNPSGIIASVLFGIFTLAQIDKKGSKETDGKNPSASRGLGLHHGSFEHLYPIETAELEEEEEIAAQQRKEFRKIIGE